MASHIAFDRRAADRNANAAQSAFIRSQVAAEYAARRNAANMRAAILSGLAVGVLVSALTLLGVL